MVQRILKPAMRQLKGRHKLVGAEIGIYLGIHAGFYLAELDIEQIFLIDPYIINRVEKRAHEKLFKYEKKIIWIKKTATEAAKYIANCSLDFVYIDGDHSYVAVIEDILNYYPKLKIGGLLAGHDYDISSVKKAVDKYMAAARLELQIEDSGEIMGKEKLDWWSWKRENNGDNKSN